jgi:hypothetical protein
MTAETDTWVPILGHVVLNQLVLYLHSHHGHPYPVRRRACLVTSAPLLLTISLGLFVIHELGRVAISALSGPVSQGRPLSAHRLMVPPRRSHSRAASAGQQKCLLPANGQQALVHDAEGYGGECQRWANGGRSRRSSASSRWWCTARLWKRGGHAGCRSKRNAAARKKTTPAGTGLQTCGDTWDYPAHQTGPWRTMIGRAPARHTGLRLVLNHRHCPLPVLHNAAVCWSPAKP